MLSTPLLIKSGQVFGNKIHIARLETFLHFNLYSEIQLKICSQVTKIDMSMVTLISNAIKSNKKKTVMFLRK